MDRVDSMVICESWVVMESFMAVTWTVWATKSAKIRPSWESFGLLGDHFWKVRQVTRSIWAVFRAVSENVAVWKPVLGWIFTNCDTIWGPEMMLKVSLDTRAKTKSLWVPIWTIYLKNLNLKRRCFEIRTCTCVEYDVKCTRTCNIADNSCKLQFFFVRLQFVITICFCKSSRDIAWTKAVRFVACKRKYLGGPFEGENQ